MNTIDRLAVVERAADTIRGALAESDPRIQRVLGPVLAALVVAAVRTPGPYRTAVLDGLNYALSEGLLSVGAADSTEE
jgi:hypothetical protein